MNNFLQINKEYFNSELKSIDILILSQVEEYNRIGQDCYISNKTFSEMFCESESGIKRSIDKLEKMKLINRSTSYCSNNGKSSKKRIISINKKNVEARFNTDLTSDKLGSNIGEARFKNDISKVHNDPIKDNIKDNIKEYNTVHFYPEKSDYDFLETFKEMIDDGVSFENCISIIQNPDNGYSKESTMFYIDEINKYIYNKTT